ncbi:hypothetical protein [Acinetobacter haemolyticus]|uniref:hypothetical protein n=1 Tax=Acinetobacter haemolyticus TaxID=29430 RepID=UPI003F568E5D
MVGVVPVLEGVKMLKRISLITTERYITLFIFCNLFSLFLLSTIKNFYFIEHFSIINIFLGSIGIFLALLIPMIIAFYSFEKEGFQVNKKYISTLLFIFCFLLAYNLYSIKQLLFSAFILLTIYLPLFFIKYFINSINLILRFFLIAYSLIVIYKTGDLFMIVDDRISRYDIDYMVNNVKKSNYKTLYYQEMVKPFRAQPYLGNFIKFSNNQNKKVDFSCSLNLIYDCNLHHQYKDKLKENKTYTINYYNIKNQHPLIIKIYDLDNRLIQDFSIKYKNEQETLKLEQLFYSISISLTLLLILTIRIK